MKDLDQHEEQIFDAAMKLPPDQRTAHLIAACHTDAHLFRRLAARLSAETSGGPPTPAFGPHQTEIVPPTEKIGDRIGPYKLIQQIGEGGFGVVYLAAQEEPVERLVAFKVIKLGMDTKEVIARFEMERQALSLMDHPNIARVLGAGITSAGRPYFVMELVNGIPITDYCDEYELTTRERIGLFMEVCNAIQHAHQKAIIHRDIKPSNILVAHRGGNPLPVVIDFGLAKATAGQRLADQTIVTAFRQFMGTLAYASPEQVEASRGGIDTRSDIYSLGVLLYELLTGLTPFDTSRFGSNSEDEMRRTIREVEPPLPSRRLGALSSAELKQIAQHRQIDPLKLVNLIRGDLDWILIKALEKDRTRRYETANGLAMDLGRHLKNEPVVARPPGRVYRAQKLVRRHKIFATAAGAVGLALFAGFGFSFWLLLQEREAHRQALAEAGKSRQVARFLIEVIKGVEPSVARGRDTTILRDILSKTAARLDIDLKNDPEVEAELRGTIGEVYMALDDYPKAEAMHRQALAIRRHLFGTENPAVAQSIHNLAGALAGEGRLGDAETLYRSALKIRRKLLGEMNVEVAATLQRLGQLLQARNNLAEAETNLRECLSIREKLMPDDWQTFQTRSLYGGVLLAEKKYSLAEPLLVSGCEGLTRLQLQLPLAARPHLKEAVLREVQLYADTGRSSLASQAAAQLGEFKNSDPEPGGVRSSP